ncbi:GyrI-like domain-containing protein [Cellulomonas sp. DKR-3]|uniref:GyrI-like domain-containing protein n=1 Tax=Cellulomonas fulva TaxID=2835530 RepID=A0ABS5U2H0_9CELL|nr:GyrI-like domain-containing protein [Cellulomonas fulva]MBT0995593.1 GyrI-like domain-containing protein [Cellulomonas fulva]
MDVERVELPAVTLVAVRRTVRMDQLAGFYDQAYGQVAQALAASGVAPAGPAVGWYAGMPTDSVDVAAGFAVPEGSGPFEGVDTVELPASAAVVGTYTGPYDGLPDAWSEVVAWAGEHDAAGRGDFWEEYVTDPSPDGDPAANVTRLVLPLR